MGLGRLAARGAVRLLRQLLVRWAPLLPADPHPIPLAPAPQVTLKSTVSTVVVTTLVLEGWSSKLNPDLLILDRVKDMLATDWRDRVGRAVDKIMAGGQLAVM
jgi:hypothetical protein